MDKIYSLSLVLQAYLCICPINCDAQTISFSKDPVVTIHSQPAKYDPKIKPLFIGGVSRLATYSGCAFSHQSNLMAVVNLAAHTLEIYTWDPILHHAVLVNRVSRDDGLKLDQPVDVTFSSNDRLLFIANLGNGTVHAYAFDPMTYAIDLNPIQVIRNPIDSFPHQVEAFLWNDEEYLGFVCGHPTSVLKIYKISSSSSLLRLDREINFKIDPKLKIKAFGFSPDRQYLVLAFGEGAKSYASKIEQSEIQIFRVDKMMKIASSPMVHIKTKGGYENLVFLKEDTFVISDQVLNQVIIYEINGEKKSLQQIGRIDANAGHLSFPHGMGVSHDGKFLAITNHGSETTVIYEVIRHD